MKDGILTFAQTCDSRECRKNYKDQITDMCDAVTTLHLFNTLTKEVTCTKCNKSYKLQV